MTKKNHGIASLFTMVPFSITTSKHPSLKGRSSMSASSTFISDDKCDKKEKFKNHTTVINTLLLLEIDFVYTI